MQVPTRKKETYRKPKPDPFITEAKYQKLKKSLNWLKNVKRPRESREVQRLAAMGDFSENAGYQLAKSRLRGLNYRILEIEEQLKYAKIIPASSDKNTVSIGSLVSVFTNGLSRTYRLLGAAETDPAAGIISYSSPLGAALLNRHLGENVKLELNGRSVVYKIIKID